MERVYSVYSGDFVDGYSLCATVNTVKDMVDASVSLLWNCCVDYVRVAIDNYWFCRMQSRWNGSGGYENSRYEVTIWSGEADTVVCPTMSEVMKVLESAATNFHPKEDN